MIENAMEAGSVRNVGAGCLTVHSALLQAAQSLGNAGIESARLDAEVLLSAVLRVERTQLYLNYDSLLIAENERRFRGLLLRRVRREPIAHIVGRKEFWSLDFAVTPGVLIPRPETERLVEIALERSRLADRSPLRILDLGTGSGVIAVCMANELPQAQIWAVDLSPAALSVARMNAERHGVSGRIRFLQGDLFAPVANETERFDLIVSNPPYVRAGELSRLQPEIREWEPITALDGGADGLDFYRRIIAEAQNYMANSAHVVLEIGAEMAGDVSRLFAVEGCFSSSSVYRDYAGKDRVIAATKGSTRG